jgi:hypothetical protein
VADEDYRQRCEALDSKQHGHFTSCPECGDEGATYRRQT